MKKKKIARIEKYAQHYKKRTGTNLFNTILDLASAMQKLGMHRTIAGSLGVPPWVVYNIILQYMRVGLLEIAPMGRRRKLNAKGRAVVERRKAASREVD
jgi:hypothetical protein